MALKLYNTASKKIESFQSMEPDLVRMYNCGPTVYGPQHIGNLSMFVFTDVLRRTLELGGFEVKQVINFTDFGHLTSDADEGEDKMAQGLKREGLEPNLENMSKLGRMYASTFLGDLEKLNIKTLDTLFPYASEHVPAQVELVETLEKKGFAYKTSDGVYFDTSKFPEYGRLGGLSSEDVQARTVSNSEKRNQRDFALWKFNEELGFPSPWGQGFPGWHIECSAMVMELLGEQIDIHTGGIEHIPVHHNNEIAQSEAATGKAPFSCFWLHREHLQMGGKKIAKSLGNIVLLADIVEKGFSPLAYRYFLLQSHYRTPTNFTWEALEASENAYRRLKEFYVSLPNHESRIMSQEYVQKFKEAIEDDLNTPEALAVVWNLVKDEGVSPALKRDSLLEFDKVLGLDLGHNEYLEVPEEIVELGREREVARNAGDFKKADEIRLSIEEKGYEIRDTGDTFLVFKK